MMKCILYATSDKGFANGLIAGGFHFATQLITGGAGFFWQAKKHILIFRLHKN